MFTCMYITILCDVISTSIDTFFCEILTTFNLLVTQRQRVAMEGLENTLLGLSS